MPRDFYTLKTEILMKIPRLVAIQTKRVGQFVYDIGPYLVFAALLIVVAQNLHAENYLKNLKTDVSDTFGQSSDLPTYLYMGEAILAAVTYIKSKNIMVLAGLPVLMAFTHFALK